MKNASCIHHNTFGVNDCNSFAIFAGIQDSLVSLEKFPEN
jgi:hypothetical protein